MKITPQDIHKQEFKTGMRGYDKDEVDAFLQMIAEQLEETLNDNAGLHDRVKELEGKTGEYHKLERNLEETLLAAQKVTEQMKGNADKEAQVILKEAELKAEKIIAEASRESERYRQEIPAHRSQRDHMLAQFKTILEQNYRFLKAITDNTEPKKE